MLFHIQSSLHPQATDGSHMWARRMQHAGGFDPAVGFCIQISQSSVFRLGSFSSPTPECQLSRAVDASDHYAGGVLQQRSGDIWQPLAFFSRKLNSAESSYSTFDGQLLACVSTIQHFILRLEGWQFFILSDHKPLSYALHRVSDPWSARQQHHPAYVAEYTSEIATCQEPRTW